MVVAIGAALVKSLVLGCFVSTSRYIELIILNIKSRVPRATQDPIQKISLFLFLALCITHPSWANNYQKPQASHHGAHSGAKRVSPIAHPNTDSVFQKLDRPIEIPGVPHFSGDSKFQFGLLRQNYDRKGGTSVALRYSTSSSAEDVIKFYYDILPKYRWTLRNTTDKQLTAALSGNIVSVKIMPRSSREYKTDFYLTSEMPRR